MIDIDKNIPDYVLKLDKLYDETVASDYVVFRLIKKFFKVQKLSFADYLILKKVISKTLKSMKY